LSHPAITLLTTLFEPSDLILFRPVESWSEGGRKRSRVDYGNVCYRPAKLATLEKTIVRLETSSESERTNLFFGVCPRVGNKGRFDFAWQIRVVRCLWADLDHCAVDQAIERCKSSSVPEPSSIVNSGNGIHLYWLLDRPFLIDDVGEPLPVETEWTVGSDGRKKPKRYILDGKDRIYLDRCHDLTKTSPKALEVQDLLAGIASVINADHTTDLTRLLRLPGTLNRKDQRNGREPVKAELVKCDPNCRYSIELFHRFAPSRTPSAGIYSEERNASIDGCRAPGEKTMEAKVGISLSDDEIIELAANKRHSGIKFASLWEGDWESQRMNSASEADSSVVFTLAYYTKDAVQIDRIFRRSGLMRPKWDKIHGSESYGEKTIAKALSKVTKQYEPTIKRITSQPKQPPSNLGFPKPAIDWDFKSDQTENAMAVEFIDGNQTKLRYVPSWKKWLAWDAKRWKVDVDQSRTTRLARRLVRNYWDRLLAIQTEKQQKEWSDFCRWANRKTTIENVISLARCDARTTIDHELLNQNMYFLNLQNGTLDLSTWEFRDHRQTDSITQIANVAYAPKAQCPKWRAFIDLIFGSDDEAKRYIQALLGYSCSGDVGEHILPICYGSGANGKSTLWNAIVELLGDYAMLAPSKLLLGTTNEHDTVIASLYQRRLVAISEPDEGSKLREARVKELTGDEQITARRMREDYWSFRRTHKFWLSTNHLPQINGTDEGIWRRIKLIPFRVDLRKVTEPIPDYHKLLVGEEGPGILNWLLDGFKDWRANGFIEPKSVIEETKSYRGSSDELGRFIADCCEVSPELVASSTELFEAYRNWGGQQSQTRFSTSMQSRFNCATRTFGRYRNKRVFEGCALSKVDEMEQTEHA
jgi:P4 family phage/plasmid primase-like protien